MGLKSLVSSGKDMVSGKLSSVSGATLAARFKGNLGSSIAVITSLIVGFLTIPNNVTYFIDNKHSTWVASDAHGEKDYNYAYVHAGIGMTVLGCLAMVVSIVLSYFAAKSKHKVDVSAGATRDTTRSTRTVYACLVMMNLELFMAVIAGCMEFLYRPLTGDKYRLHAVECAIAVFNIITYAMYVVTMILTSTILRGKHEKEHSDSGQLDFTDVVTNTAITRDYMTRASNMYHSQPGYMM